MRLTTASISRAVALGFITINIFLVRVRLFSSRGHESPCSRQERENQRPVDKRSLFIATKRALRRTVNRLRFVLNKTYQRSLPASIFIGQGLSTNKCKLRCQKQFVCCGAICT